MEIQQFREIKKFVVPGINQIVLGFQNEVLSKNNLNLEVVCGHPAISSYAGVKRQSLSYFALKAIDPTRQVQLDGLLKNYNEKRKSVFVVENGVIFDPTNGNPNASASDLVAETSQPIPDDSIDITGIFEIQFADGVWRKVQLAKDYTIEELQAILKEKQAQEKAAKKQAEAEEKAQKEALAKAEADKAAEEKARLEAEKQAAQTEPTE